MHRRLAALVHERVRDAMLEKIVEVGKRAWRPATRSIPRPRLGAIVDEVQLETVLGYIDAGRQRGRARARRRQPRARRTPAAATSSRRCSTDVKPDMRIAREEIFGPVLSTITFKDAEEAVRSATT